MAASVAGCLVAAAPAAAQEPARCGTLSEEAGQYAEGCRVSTGETAVQCGTWDAYDGFSSSRTTGCAVHEGDTETVRCGQTSWIGHRSDGEEVACRTPDGFVRCGESSSYYETTTEWLGCSVRDGDRHTACGTYEQTDVECPAVRELSSPAVP